MPEQDCIATSAVIRRKCKDNPSNPCAARHERVGLWCPACLRNEVERLREALRVVADCDYVFTPEVMEVVRDALDKSGGPDA